MPPVRLDSAHFSGDTVSFLRVLHERGVRYLIVGGEAVIFHGRVRLTGDVDFFFATDEGNELRLFAALDEFWDGDIPGVANAAELAEDGLILQFGRPPNRIDLLNRIDGVVFEEAWRGRVETLVVTSAGEVPVPFIGVEDLIRNKRASGRPRDLDDLAYLEKVRNDL